MDNFTYVVRGFPDFPPLPLPPQVILIRPQELFFVNRTLDFTIVLRIISGKIGRFNEPGKTRGLTRDNSTECEYMYSKVNSFKEEQVHNLTFYASSFGRSKPHAILSPAAASPPLPRRPAHQNRSQTRIPAYH